MNEERSNQTSKEASDTLASSAPAGQAVSSSPGGGTRITSILAGIAAKLGFGRDKAEKNMVGSGDVSTGLAHQRTDLAMERNYLAAERTLMAWIRTSLSMISFGFTIGKLGQVLHQVNVKGVLGRVRSVSVENIAYFLVILGTGALIGASVQHWHRLRELRAMGLRRQLSMTLLVAILLSAVGGFTLGALILAL